ncbi:ribonuclease H-like domain-containing protein [Tanacetum coccineum]|uniref:Ribonuclease H-like domain-containing protein n=1 Tax=Tanacetum coccineum TaxID=301880 RepID=A0ABQ5C2C5_9ASTR
MIGSDIPIPTTLLSDKLSLVTHHHLLTRVPVKLDLEEWNYGSWEYFFVQLCSGYDVLKFIHGIPTDASTTSTSIPFTSDELKVDKIILSWIFTTISDPLQKRLVTRASTLKTELRSIQLGALSMEAYFQKIESILTTLTSLDCVVNDEDVVHYVIGGLPEKYNQVCGYMHYQTPFPDLKTVRSLLVTEEMRLKSKEIALPVDSSSPMVLLAQSGNTRRPSNPQVKSWKPCFSFAKGSCRFRSDCRYVHDPNAKPVDNSFSKHSRSNHNTTDTLLMKLLDKLGVNDTGSSSTRNATTTPTVTPTLPVAYHTSPISYAAQPTSHLIPPPGFYTQPLAQQAQPLGPPSGFHYQQA